MRGRVVWLFWTFRDPTNKTLAENFFCELFWNGSRKLCRCKKLSINIDIWTYIWWELFSKIFQIIGWFGQMGWVNCGVFGVFTGKAKIADYGQYRHLCLSLYYWPEPSSRAYMTSPGLVIEHCRIRQCWDSSVGIMLPYLYWGKLRTKLERGLLNVRRKYDVHLYS